MGKPTSTRTDVAVDRLLPLWPLPLCPFLASTQFIPLPTFSLFP